MDRTNTPGVEVDLRGRIDAYFAAAKDAFSCVDVLKTYVGRVVDAVAPTVLDAARAVAEAGKVAAEGRVYVSVRTGSRFAFAFASRDPATGLFQVLGAKVEPRLDASPTARARLDEMTAAMEARRAREGKAPLSGRDARGLRVGLELRLAETYGREGFPDDVPYGPDVEIDAVFGIEAPSLEEAIRATEDKVKGGFSPWVAFGARPSHAYGSEPNASPGRWGAGDPGLGDPCACLEPLASMAPLARTLGLADGIAARSREVGTRGYLAYYPEGDAEGRAVQEAGQALALMDGGLPGADVRAALRTFFARVGGLYLRTRSDDVERILQDLHVHDHTSEENAYELHCGHVYLDGRGGTDVLTLHDDNGDLVLECLKDAEGTLRGYRMARFEEGRADEALAMLRAGEVAFAGFRGAYSIADDGVACVAEPPLTTRAIRDLSLVESILAEASCTLEETYSVDDRSP